MEIREAKVDGLADLLFNLASTDRLRLLTEIAARKQRMSTLSKAIGASVPECSRHLARLCGAGLVKKDSEGLYGVTAVGKMVLTLLPSLQLTLEHKEYFQSHDLSFLPNGFVERIGDLAGSSYIGHISQGLERMKDTVSGAREYACLIVDQPIMLGRPGGPSFSLRGLPVRLIFEPTVDSKVLAAINSELPNCKIATLKEVKVAMGLNEKTAGVIFPTLGGRLDFGAGFFGENPQFLGWCNELFEYYWSKSTKVHSPTPFSSG